MKINSREEVQYNLIYNESNLKDNDNNDKYFNIILLILNKLKLYKRYSKSILIIIIFIILLYPPNTENSINENSNEIKINGNKAYLSKEYIEKFNSYIDICQNDILLDKDKLSLVSNPKISVTIPIYNAENYLYYSLRSIQNQKLKEIEIILIDDCSTDNSVKIIEEYMKEDPRIRLIKNEKNRRILYSKSIAALNANGEYITQIDQDDILIRDDVFDILYNEAAKNDLDLVQFRDFILEDFILHKKQGLI